MKKKHTLDLQRELVSSCDISQFLSDNQDQFVRRDFASKLQELFNKSRIAKATLAKRAGISEVYLYQLFSGERIPSRDKAICLCVGLGATLEETQELLKHSGLAQLYAKHRRDAIVMYGLNHGMDLMELNDLLFSENEDTLC